MRLGDPCLTFDCHPTSAPLMYDHNCHNIYQLMKTLFYIHTRVNSDGVYARTNMYITLVKAFCLHTSVAG